MGEMTEPIRMSSDMDERAPLVSVVMPVYNCVDFVRQAIDSILQQTFAGFEFVIVDDGSTDGTSAILKGLTDPRVRVIHASHDGFLAALERGVREARGNWVARMDADDVAHPERLQHQLAFLQSHPDCVFVGSVYGLVTPNNKFLAPKPIFDWRYVEKQMITIGPQYFADPSVVFERQLGLKVGLYDPEFEGIEVPLWYKLLCKGQGAVIGDCLYYYRVQPKSLARSEFQKRYAWSREIRWRYDPENAALLPLLGIVDDEKESIRATARSVILCLLAGDKSSARHIAWQAWKRQPLKASMAKIAAKSLLGWRSLRFWSRPTTDDKYVPIPHPW